MHIKINSRDFSITPALQQFIEAKIQFALNRYAQRIRVLEISLKDINGPRGGIDKQCTIKMKINQFKTLVVEDTSADAYESVVACTQRAKRRMERHYTRARTQSRRSPVIQ
ncbi:HPF/RaiA family ribosome-associated protein [Alteromonas oceanisediminis]|uniref:HPF/RaiA family ribosome-associated protein n=1 Tax=Alteromonas oceanisediminis TaxID=2836180 RepID=UPI001BDB3F3F|nr:HPF/RaiA family ribosome-associated protein [Alteromonas oceanisediminis]MBT0586514.1 HPF/RaiA family ribosome-associated protein [Alteromonas oceanisediminis]